MVITKYRVEIPIEKIKTIFSIDITAKNKKEAIKMTKHEWFERPELGEVIPEYRNNSLGKNAKVRVVHEDR